MEFEYGKIEIPGEHRVSLDIPPSSDKTLQSSFSINTDKMSRTLDDFRVAVRSLSLQKENEKAIIAKAQDKVRNSTLRG